MNQNTDDSSADTDLPGRPGGEAEDAEAGTLDLVGSAAVEEPAAATPNASERKRRPAALDLVREAAEAIRASEERAADLEAQMREITERFTGEVESAKSQIAAAEKRADAAEARALEAEDRMREAEDMVSELSAEIVERFSGLPTRV